DDTPIGNEAQLRLRALGIRGHVVAIHQDPARRRLQQPRDDPNGGRLARTVRSEKAVNLPRRHVEADVVHRGEAAVLLDEILNRDHLIAWGPTPTPAVAYAPDLDTGALASFAAFPSSRSRRRRSVAAPQSTAASCPSARVRRSSASIRAPGPCRLRSSSDGRRAAGWQPACRG